jgi:osmotically-inducible protein OsmY
VRRRIVEGLHRNADVDTRHITVELFGDGVRLDGTVGTWQQREAAARAAGVAPGMRTWRIEVVPRSLDAVPDEIC